jgi:hypothetical protein
MPAFSFLLFLFALTFNCETLKASDLKEEANIESINLTLKHAQGTITCSDYKNLKQDIAKDIAAYKTGRSFGEPEKNDIKNPSFIIFDMKSWTISVCDKGKVVTATLDSKRTEESQIELGNPYLADMNNDGKTEFIIGDLQCVEGPCIGNYYLMQIDGSSIKKLNVIHTTFHSLKDTGKEKILELKKLCFTHEFGIGIEWFTVGTFEKNRILTELPYTEIKIKYPSLIKDFEASLKSQAENLKNFPTDKMNETYAAVSNLLLRAYNGEPAKKLHSELDALIKPFEKTGGLPIYCDPKALISMITK